MNADLRPLFYDKSRLGLNQDYSMEQNRDRRKIPEHHVRRRGTGRQRGGCAKEGDLLKLARAQEEYGLVLSKS